MADKEQKLTPALYMEQTTDLVMKKIDALQNKGEINFPANYSPSNALRSACLMLQETRDKDQKLALEVCTPQSIQNALFNMVLLALSPAKKQVYPIVRGKTLCLDPSYFGVIAATKRINGVIDVFAQVVYQDDDFEYVIEQSRKVIKKHDQKLSNIDNDKIIGAYCTILYRASDGEIKEFSEVMSKPQILKSWSKTSMRNNTVQQEFPEEMAKRTVIKRTCKSFVNTSDDSDLIIEAYNASDSEPTDSEQTLADEVKNNANKEPIKVNYTVEEESDASEDKDEETPSPELKATDDEPEAPRRRNF